MNASPDVNEMVMVATPQRFYSLVIQTIAEAIAKESKQQDTEVSPNKVSLKEATTEPLIDWTDVAIMKKLRAGKPARVALKMLDMTAAKAGQKVSFADIYPAAGFSHPHSAKSSIGSFSKVLKRDFGLSVEQAKVQWPVEKTYGDLGEAYYKMSPAVAQAWAQSA